MFCTLVLFWISFYSFNVKIMSAIVHCIISTHILQVKDLIQGCFIMAMIVEIKMLQWE